MKIHKDDQVVVIAGKDRGKKKVKVLKTFEKKGKIIVAGVNKKKKFMKKTQSRPGQIIEREYPASSSNFMIVCPHCTKPTRIGYAEGTSGKKVRKCKKCQETFK